MESLTWPRARLALSVGREIVAKRGNYQSTNSVVLAEPVSTSIGTAVLDLVERLVEIVKKLLTLLHMRAAVGMAIGLVLKRRW